MSFAPFPTIHKQVLAGRRWALECPPTRRCLFVCFCFVQSGKANLGTEGTLPWPPAEGPPKKRRICISSAGGLIYRRNVNGISCLVACNPLQSSSAAEMVLLHAKVLNYHGGSMGMTLAQSDTHLRPQSHGSFNTTSWELPWVLYGHLFGHFCEVWSFQKEKGTGSRVHKFQTKAKVRKKKMRMK